MRRIKSVSLTIPCVTGPYTSVSCTLALLSNQIRKNTYLNSGNNGYTEEPIGSDSRFIYNTGGIQSIATSSAQNDSGMFELNFHDERYLPFEGAGVISTWHLELPTNFGQFDYDTISDVIFHLRYTARDGGETLKEAVKTYLNEAVAGGSTGMEFFRLFSAKQEFPNEWHRFLYTTSTLELDLSPDRFPYMFRDRNIQINRIDIFLKLKEENSTNVNVGILGQTKTLDTYICDGKPVPGLLYDYWDNLTGATGDWSIVVDNTEGIEDIGILCYYTIAAK